MMKSYQLGVVALALAGSSALADWNQTAAGNYNYADTANWTDGTPNGVFPETLSIAGAQTITFADGATVSGLTIAQTGTGAITFAGSSVTLAGDFSNTGSGEVTFASGLAVDLGGATRTFTTAKNLTFAGTLTNGGILTAGAGTIHFSGANAHADGTTIGNTGVTYIENTSAFGTGRLTLGEGCSLDSRVSKFDATLPITLAGSFTWTTGNKQNPSFGAGDLTILKPLVATVNSGYTLAFGGQVAADSPCDILAIAKTGGGSLKTVADIEIPEGTTRTIAVNQYNWYWGGKISGGGTLAKTGGGLLQMSAVGSFAGTFDIQGGPIQFANNLTYPTAFTILLRDGGTYTTYNNTNTKVYNTAAKALANAMIDSKSTGTIALAGDESDTVDFTKAPYVRLAPSSSDRTVKGLVPPPSGVLQLGGGGKTLRINDALPAGCDIDATKGSIQFVADQPAFDGTLTCGAGYTIIIGSDATVPNGTLVSDGGTVRFGATTAGEFVRAKAVKLFSADMLLDVPKNGSVTHRVGTLTLDLSESVVGGISRITNTNALEAVSCLSVGKLVREVPEQMLSLVQTEGDRLIVENEAESDIGLVGTGSHGTVYAPVVPWMICGTSIATYETDVGFRALAAGEYTEYAADYEGPVLNPGENVRTTGNGTVTFTESAHVGSIQTTGSVNVSHQSIAGGEGVVLTVDSGAVAIVSGYKVKGLGAPTISVGLDFGGRHGYICVGGGYVYHLQSPIAGSAGLTLADTNTVASGTGNGAYFYNNGHTYAGDVWVFGFVYHRANGAFPYGETLTDGTVRVGTVRLYGTIANNGWGTFSVGSIVGPGSYLSSGSGQSRLNLGGDNRDSDIGGTLGSEAVGSGGANFDFQKVGTGKLRVGGIFGGKGKTGPCTPSVIDGGELQVDGRCHFGSRSANYHLVISDGTLSGSGRVSDNSECGTIQVLAKGVLAPGSDKTEGQTLTLCKSVELTQGAAMKFTVTDKAAAQICLEAGCSLAGDATSIPVTVVCTAKKSGTWMLLEADSFGGKTFALDKKTSVSGGHVSVAQVKAEDGTVAREQLWYELKKGFTVTLR